MDKKEQNLATTAVHGGEPRPRPGDAVTTPIFATSTYTFKNTKELCDHHEGVAHRMEYGRYGNPTQIAAEKKIAALEGAEDALLFSSGMSAVTTTLLAMLSGGHDIVLTNDCYRKTRQFARQVLKKFAVNVHLVAPDDYAGMAKLFAEKRPRLLISESPTNPYLNILDLERVVAIAKEHRVKVLIDSTFATPVNQRPLEFGVDLVMHSATKYLGGHNDLLAGVICGSEPCWGHPRLPEHARRNLGSSRGLSADSGTEDPAFAGGPSKRLGSGHCCVAGAASEGDPGALPRLEVPPPPRDCHGTDEGIWRGRLL